MAHNRNNNNNNNNNNGDYVIEMNEEKISTELGSAYNHSVRGNKDNSETTTLSQIPHRHIVRWYITKEDDTEPPKQQNEENQSTALPISMKRRYPLPDDRIFDNTKYTLHGHIIPYTTTSTSTSTTTTNNSSSNQNTKQEIPIALKQLKHWEVDTSIKHRGIWIRTNQAWYYLKNPCNTAVPKVVTPTKNYGMMIRTMMKSNYFYPSQEDLHLPLRAKVGLLSNIIDIFTEAKEGKLCHYAPLHAKVTIEESYKMLCLDSVLRQTKYKHIQNEAQQQQEPLNEEPFDLVLLKQKDVPLFIREHIVDLHLTLSDDSTYIKSLLSLIEKPINLIHQQGHEWHDNDYRKSAEQAERRSKRSSWCELISLNEEVKPNRLIDLTIGNGKSEEGESNDTNKSSVRNIEEMKKAVEGTAEKILDGQKNSIFVMTEKTSFDGDMMIEAISNVSDFLLPKPTEEDKRKTDYAKFSLDQSRLQEFFQNYVLNESVVSLELMLLVVKVITQSGDKVMKALFKFKNNTATIHAGTVLFRYWLGYAFGVMEKRRHRFSRIKPKIGETRSEELVASAIFDLIAKFRVIKSEKQITTLKNKYSIDWIGAVRMGFAYVDAHGISNVIASCKLAADRLEKILGKGVLTNQPINSSDIMKNEAKKPNTEVESTKSIEDANRSRIAKMIEESKKRNKLVEDNAAKQKALITSVRKSSDGQKLSQPPSTNKVVNTTTRVQSKPTSSTTVSKRIVDSKAKMNDSSRKAEPRFVKASQQNSEGYPSTNPKTMTVPPREHSNNVREQSSTYVNTEERIKTKSENGLIGLPLGSSWKITPKVEIMPKTFTKKEEDPKPKVNTNVQSDHERLTDKGVDGLIGLPFIQSWKQNNFDLLETQESSKRNIEGSGVHGDGKRRKLGSDSYFVPPNNMNRVETRPARNGLNPSPHNAVTEVVREHSGGRGRGRGKDVNKPAWLTRQENNSVTGKSIDSSSTSSTQNVHANKSSSGSSSSGFQNFHSSNSVASSVISSSNGVERGRGRGRGKDINKPAWMTRGGGDTPLQSTSNPVQAPSKANSNNSIPNQEQRFHPNATATAGVGRGRGRGRGKDMNKPAWMTRQEGNSNTNIAPGQGTTSFPPQDNSNPVQAPSKANSNNPTPNQEQRFHPNATATAGIGRGRGRGRGKDMNKPAWMTRQEGHSNTNIAAGQGTTSFPPQDKSVNSLDIGRGANVSSRVPGGSVSRGRGRGKDMNKPAWMTHQETASTMSMNSVSTTTSRNTSRNTSQHSVVSNTSSAEVATGQGRGRGRGRGKDMNKPAWMTMQERNNNSHASITQTDFSKSAAVDNYSTHTRQGVGVGVGVGRGKHVNAPAWMTQNKELPHHHKSSTASSGRRDRTSTWVPPSNRRDNSRKNW